MMFLAGGGGDAGAQAVRTLGQLCGSYLSSATAVSLHSVESNHEPPDPHDASMESFDCLLETWVSVVKGADGSTVIDHSVNDTIWSAVASCSADIYNTMVASRLRVALSVIVAQVDDDDECVVLLFFCFFFFHCLLFSHIHQVIMMLFFLFFFSSFLTRPRWRFFYLFLPP